MDCAILELMVQIPFSKRSLDSSNNCKRKLLTTLGDAKTKIRLFTPTCFIYERISSDTPMAVKLLPLPKPLYNSKLL